MSSSAAARRPSLPFGPDRLEGPRLHLATAALELNRRGVEFDHVDAEGSAERLRTLFDLMLERIDEAADGATGGGRTAP